MKKHMITAALVAVMALGLGTVAGCSQEAPREDVNAQANPMLADATALPADHYAGGDAGSLEMDPTHEQCITCHAQA